MKFIKTIENLLTKAEQKGSAKINGRMSYGWGAKGDLEEKYKIHITRRNILFMYHWGTLTACIDLNTKEINSYYGESVSDRDSLNTLLYLLDIEGKFRYLPSKDLFIYEK
ncbi:hypothetical protein LCFBJUUZ_CDS0110 [Staphylococcus phage PG-2021_76]